jgi:hypothetical protein
LNLATGCRDFCDNVELTSITCVSYQHPFNFFEVKSVPDARKLFLMGYRHPFNFCSAKKEPGFLMRQSAAVIYDLECLKGEAAHGTIYKFVRRGWGES